MQIFPDFWQNNVFIMYYWQILDILHRDKLDRTPMLEEYWQHVIEIEFTNSNIASVHYLF